MRALKFLSTKYWSVVALPSLTSCVHCSSGSLMPKALSMANAISRKSRLSMPRSLMAWLSGMMESRGISQVSAMILAMVSKVEDICNSLVDLGFWHAGGQRAQGPRRSPLQQHFRGKRLAARIAKQRDKFNGDGHLARNRPSMASRPLELQGERPTSV